MYSPEKILWIKNIKRKQGTEWAYDDVSCNDTFLLNWPSGKKGSASTPLINDIIILFQKPNKINGKRNYKVHLTHLVSPISTEIHVDENAPNHKWCREVKLIAIASPIHAIPNPGYFNFFLPNRGLTNPIINLTNTIDLNETETKERVWNLFVPYFCPQIADQIFIPENPEGIFGEVEGDTIIKNHIRIEYARRNSAIVQQAKSEALRRGNGRIICECCEFDFVERYGQHGTGFIECHHKIFISLGQRITQLSDLALVCSNCHRMLHRRKEDGTYHTVEELRGIIQLQQHE